MNHSRRQLITGIPIVGAGALLVGCRNNNGPASSATNKENKPDDDLPTKLPLKFRRQKISCANTESYVERCSSFRKRLAS